MQIEVAFALADEQRLLALSMPANSTVADAILASKLAQAFPEVDFDVLDVGIWGHVVAREHSLADGDRVEIYRPLQIDPREARRQLASLGQTMGARQKG